MKDKTTLVLELYQNGTFNSEKQVDFGGKTGAMWYYLQVPGSTLGAGDFRIDCVLDGQVKKSLSFVVKP